MRVSDGVSIVGQNLGEALLIGGHTKDDCGVLHQSQQAFEILGGRDGFAAVDKLLAEHCGDYPDDPR